MTFLGVVGWFPQDYAPQFYIVKGLLACVSTLLLIFHMSKTWPELRRHATSGQRMRYYSLLAFSILVTGSSLEQYDEGQLVSYRHLGSIIVTIMLIWAMVISIRDEHRNRQ